jgi:hypothetical protein
MSRLYDCLGEINTLSALFLKLKMVDVTEEVTTAGRSERLMISKDDDLVDPMLQSPKFNSDVDSFTIDVHTRALHWKVKRTRTIILLLLIRKAVLAGWVTSGQLCVLESIAKRISVSEWS